MFQQCCSYGTQLDRKGKIPVPKIKLKPKTYLYPFLVLKVVTHQTDIIELAVTQADCDAISRHLCLVQKIVLEHTAKITAN